MDKIINTVSTIFRQRYGTQLKIKTEFSSSLKTKNYYRNHWNSPFVYSRTLRQVSFPIFNSKKELQAIAVASPVENKDAIIFDEMAQFLQLTISEHIELTARLEDQVQTQVAIERAHGSNQKVVQLKTRKAPAVPHITYKKPPIKREASTQPIWIESNDENFTAQIAFSIHDWLSNWAFINAKEIPDLIWEDPNHWQNFSQVTIFIPNVDELSEDRIKVMIKNLELVEQSGQKPPMVIVSSRKEPKSELQALRALFKYYKANTRVTSRVQAHFLLYQFGGNETWTHSCPDTGGVYFLPFSPGPQNLH